MSFIISYHDGNNNCYEIHEDKVCYLPMIPKMSSSGMYSSGKPWKKTISVSELEELKMLVAAAFACKDEHISDRVKGSGLIQQGEFNCILAMNSLEKAKLEKALKGLD